MFEFLGHWAGLVRVALDRRRAVEGLDRLADWQLADLGIERGTIAERVERGMPWPVSSAAPNRARPAPAPAMVCCG